MNDAAGAERHLLAAVVANEAAGRGPTWTAMAQLDLAELYLHGAESDSDTKSTTLVRRALQAVEDTGAARITTRAHGILDRLGARP